MNDFYSTLNTKLGVLHLITDSKKVKNLQFNKPKISLAPNKQLPSIMLELKQQLQEYLKGDRKLFNVSIDLQGDPKYINLWETLTKNVGYGQTLSYKKLGQSVNPKMGPRQVGHAMAINPIAIIVPCHRIIGSDKKLHGYGGGFNAKKFLLNLESNHTTDNC